MPSGWGRDGHGSGQQTTPPRAPLPNGAGVQCRRARPVQASVGGTRTRGEGLRGVGCHCMQRPLGPHEDK